MHNSMLVYIVYVCIQHHRPRPLLSGAVLPGGSILSNTRENGRWGGPHSRYRRIMDVNKGVKRGSFALARRFRNFGRQDH